MYVISSKRLRWSLYILSFVISARHSSATGRRLRDDGRHAGRALGSSGRGGHPRARGRHPGRAAAPTPAPRTAAAARAGAAAAAAAPPAATRGGCRTRRVDGPPSSSASPRGRFAARWVEDLGRLEGGPGPEFEDEREPGAVVYQAGPRVCDD